MASMLDSPGICINYKLVSSTTQAKNRRWLNNAQVKIAIHFFFEEQWNIVAFQELPTAAAPIFYHQGRKIISLLKKELEAFPN